MERLSSVGPHLPHLKPLFWIMHMFSLIYLINGSQMRVWCVMSHSLGIWKITLKLDCWNPQWKSSDLFQEDARGTQVAQLYRLPGSWRNWATEEHKVEWVPGCCLCLLPQKSPVLLIVFPNLRFTVLRSVLCQLVDMYLEVLFRPQLLSFSKITWDSAQHLV